MTTLYIATRAAQLSNEFPEAADLLLNLEKAETAHEVREALDTFDCETQD